MKIILALAIVLLTGCSGPMQFLANTYDRNDPCQTGQFNEAERQRLGRPVGYQQPSWCGASNNRVYIYNNGNVQQGYIKR